LWKTLEGEENGLGLFGDQIIGSITGNISAQLHLKTQTSRDAPLNPPHSLVPARWRCPYFNPSFLYPAALAYQLANGITIFLSHGRFTI
jgi:hypothetical protein